MGTWKGGNLLNAEYAVKTIFRQCTQHKLHAPLKKSYSGVSRESDGNLPKNKRRKTGDTMTKRKETQQCVLDIAEELKEMHEDSELKLKEVQYRLWARMLVILLEYTPARRLHPKFR